MLLSRSIRLAFAALFLATPAAAQLGNKPVQVINPPGETLAVTHPDGINVNNFPATQTVDGTVNVGNLPASQTVDGTVNIGNFPATQNVSISNLPLSQVVSGTVNIGNEVSVLPAEGISHLGQPIGEHFTLRLNGYPSIGNFGHFSFSAIGPDGGGASGVAIFPGQCMVILKVQIHYRSIEFVGAGTIDFVPNALLEFAAGPSDGSDVIPVITFTSLSDDNGWGVIDLEPPGGLVIEQPDSEPGYQSFGIRSNPPSDGTGAPFPRIFGFNGWVSGYTIPC